MMPFSVVASIQKSHVCLGNRAHIVLIRSDLLSLFVIAGATGFANLSGRPPRDRRLKKLALI